MEVALGEEVSARVLALQPLKRFTVQGRTGRKLTIIRAADGSLTAVDFHCFHHGQALGDGHITDIEEVGTVLKCPAHGYVVDCKTGERLVCDEGDGWQRHGVVQRTHQVVVSDDAQRVSIMLSDSSGITLASDAYNMPASATDPSRVGSASMIAFQCRKSRATQAVARAHGTAAARAAAVTAALASASASKAPTDMRVSALAAPPAALTVAPFPTRTLSAASIAASPASARPVPIMRQATLDGMFAGAAARRTATAPEPPAPSPPPSRHEDMDRQCEDQTVEAMDTS